MDGPLGAIAIGSAMATPAPSATSATVKIGRFELASWQIRVRHAILRLAETSLRWKCPGARAMVIFSDILPFPAISHHKQLVWCSDIGKIGFPARFTSEFTYLPLSLLDMLHGDALDVHFVNCYVISASYEVRVGRACELALCR